MLQPKEGGRALGLLEVRYAHWGYSLEIVAAQRDSRWAVRFTIASVHWHGD